MAKSRFTDQTALIPTWNERAAGAGTPSWGALSDAARKKATRVEDFGLSPEDYIAVVPTELGVAGKVNRNERVYPADRFVGENARLAAEIKAGVFSPAEAGHPEAPATLNIAARLVEVSLEDGAGRPLAFNERERAPVLPNVVKATGKIAFLKTRVGEDLWTLYKAGMALGMSSVSYGEAVPHKIEADSPYAKDNPAAVGSTIDIIEGQDLVRYDVVVDPSASTYLRTDEATRAAYESLRAQFPTLAPIQQIKEASPASGGDTTMKMDLATLKAEYPDLFKQITESAALAALAEADTAAPVAARIRALPAKDQARMAKVLAAVLPEGAATKALGDGDDDALVLAIRAEVAPVRERVTTLETEIKAAKGEVKAANEARKAAEKIAEDARAELAKRDLREKVGGAVKVAVEAVHKNLRTFVEAEIAPLVEAGTIATPEAAEAEVKRLAAFAEKISTATAKVAAGETTAIPADTGADIGEAKTAKGGGNTIDESAAEDPILAALSGEYNRGRVAAASNATAAQN